MKLAECSDEFRYELGLMRLGSRRGNPPDGSVWWNEQFICSVCAGRLCQSVLDHCHTSGFNRGWLCYSCNVSEAHHGGPVWESWRRTAPMLADRVEYIP